MKVKKLLSIGAIGLTVAFCTSVGVFATSNVLSAQQKEVVKGIIKSYSAGVSPINNLNVNKNTKIGDIINSDSEYYKEIEEQLNSYEEGSNITDVIKDVSIGEILDSTLIYASLNKENFEAYKAMTNDVTNQLIEIGKTTDEATRAIKEQKASEMINSTYGTVKFGKNSEGRTTLSLEKDNKIILQINTANAEKLVNALNSFDTYDEFQNFLSELGINS